MRSRQFLLALAAVALVTALAEPAAARVEQRARFQAPQGESLLVHGEYPPVRSSCLESVQPVLHARYRGAIEVGRAADGSLFVIGELPFEEYLKGIAEVPRSWPMEALKAQAVAARSYAAVQLERSTSDERALGYDLCATTACQVYVGMGVAAGAWGDRWALAVDETAGEVLLHRGEPAETFYFSTSNGRTYTNQQIWGSEPRSYLPSISEPDDGESPLSRWEVRVPLRDLSRFLRAAGRWDGGRIVTVRDRGDHIVIRGGGRARLHRDELRSALNGAAWCLAPDRYPTTEPDGYRLPQTVPSTWYRAAQEGANLVLEGRGWGHGVGMVQWGAKGKADRGLAYDEILAAYYGGLRPQADEPHDTIRVLIARGLRSVLVAPSGEATVRGPGPGDPPRGPWSVTAAGRRIRVRHATPPEPLLAIDDVRVREGDRFLRAAFTAPKSLRVRLEVLSDGEVVDAGAWRNVHEGTARIRGPLPDASGAHEIRLVATDGVDTIVVPAEPVAASAGAGSPPPPPAPSPTGVAAPRAGGGPSVRVVVIAGLAAAGLGLLLTAALRKRLHRG